MSPCDLFSALAFSAVVGGLLTLTLILVDLASGGLSDRVREKITDALFWGAAATGMFVVIMLASTL